MTYFCRLYRVGLMPEQVKTQLLISTSPIWGKCEEMFSLKQKTKTFLSFPRKWRQLPQSQIPNLNGQETSSDDVTTTISVDDAKTSDKVRVGLELWTLEETKLTFELDHGRNLSFLPVEPGHAMQKVTPLTRAVRTFWLEKKPKVLALSFNDVTHGRPQTFFQGRAKFSRGGWGQKHAICLRNT